MAARIVIMAGGTGGHVFPALAVAQELRDRGWEVSWLGTPDSFESRTVPQYGFEISTIDSFRLRGQNIFSLVFAPSKLLRAIWQALAVLRAKKPDVVLGMGGFATGPGGIAAGLLALPLVIHEQNAIPGMTNRWLSKIADRVLEAFPGSFKPSANAIETGNPVRSDIEASQRAPSDNEPLKVLVIGGSLGAVALNERLPETFGLIEQEQRPLIRHQAGRNKLDATVSAYAEADVDAEVTEFIDDMAEAYQWADLMICRAGALTVSELAIAGMPAVLVPFPHAVDDHQTKNGSFLVDKGAALLIQQNELNASLLADQIKVLTNDRQKLRDMAEAAAALARPQATQMVADYCVEVAA